METGAIRQQARILAGSLSKHRVAVGRSQPNVIIPTSLRKDYVTNLLLLPIFEGDSLESRPIAQPGRHVQRTLDQSSEDDRNCTVFGELSDWVTTGVTAYLGLHQIVIEKGRARQGESVVR